jgi:hypothetical protein
MYSIYDGTDDCSTYTVLQGLQERAKARGQRQKATFYKSALYNAEQTLTLNKHELEGFGRGWPHIMTSLCHRNT